MEMEVMEARLIRASELNGEMDDDDTGKSDFFTYTKNYANFTSPFNFNKYATFQWYALYMNNNI